MSKKIDAATQQLMNDLEQGLREAKAGEVAAVHTPDQIAARGRGRPAGSTKANAKESVNIRLDPDLLAVLRATGDGWQSRVNRILRERFAL